MTDHSWETKRCCDCEALSDVALLVDRDKSLIADWHLRDSPIPSLYGHDSYTDNESAVEVPVSSLKDE